MKTFILALTIALTSTVSCIQFWIHGKPSYECATSLTAKWSLLKSTGIVAATEKDTVRCDSAKLLTPYSIEAHTGAIVDTYKR